MQDRLETRAKRRCRGCNKPRPKSAFQLLPSRVRNVYCVHCVEAAQRDTLAKMAAREAEQERRRVLASWKVTR